MSNIIKNGDLVRGSSVKTIKIWNIKTRECIQTLNCHTGSVLDLFELKNRNIISGSGFADGTIKI